MSISSNAAMADAIPPKESTKPGQSSEIRAEIAQEREQIARLTNLYKVHRRSLMRRAVHFWEVDRQSEVETIATRLESRPGLTVARLKKTFHGCSYLIERWNYLSRRMLSPKFTGQFTPSDRSKALNLAGIPRDEHDLECYPIDTPTVGRDRPTWRKEAILELSAVIWSDVAELNELLADLKIEDQERQEQAQLGEFHGVDRLLNQYERAIQGCERRIRRLEKLQTAPKPPSATSRVASADAPPQSSAASSTEPTKSVSDPLADMNE